MNTSRSIRDFLVGKRHIESRQEFKNAMLRGFMALIALVVGVLYLIIDYLNGVQGNELYYATIVLLALVTIGLNHARRYQLATSIFLVTINFIIFLFASSDVYRTGIYMFFICSSLSAFALFGFARVKFAFLFSGISLALFLISHWTGFPLLPVMQFNEAAIHLNLTNNFLVALGTSVLIVYFLISSNHRSEEELRQTSRDLEKSRERIEMVIEATRAGIYEWRPPAGKVYVTPAWKELLGYGEQELQGLDVDFYFNIVHPEDLERTKENMALHFQHRQPYSSEVRIRTKSGEYRWFRDSGHTRFDETGKPIVTVGSVVDIHERKLVEEKIIEQNDLLAKANAELDRFVYSVSHDLRAPLSSILGLTNLYKLSTDSAERESVVKLIRDRADTLDAFISEILDYSRNARTELKHQAFSVADLVHEVLKGLTYMKGFDKIRIDVEVPSSLILTSDRERIKMVLNNLLTNAIKYSDPHKNSFVIIESSTTAGQWNLSVRDNGIGIKPEHHSRIFDMFYQAHDSGHGSGLGLYIVREVLQRLGGDVSFESEYAAGSVFKVSLPIQKVTYVNTSLGVPV